MRAGQPVKAGAIDVELFENGDPTGLGGEKRGLGGDDVVVGETAAREAFAHEHNGALGLGQRLIGDSLGFKRPRREKDLEAGDLPLAFLSERRHVGLGRDAFEPRTVDGGLIPIVAAERYGPADHQTEILPIPEMADTDADGGVGRRPRLFETDPRPRDVAMRGQNREVDLGGGACDLMGGAGVLEVSRIEEEVGGADPETPQSGAGQTGLYFGLIEVDLGLSQLGLGPGAGEQRIARHVDPTLHFNLEPFGQGETFASDLKVGLGAQGLRPGALHLLKAIQPPDRGFGLNQSGLATSQGDTRRSITAPFEPLLIGQCRLGAVDDVAAAQCRQVLNHQAQRRIGANVGLTHSGVASARPRLHARESGVYLSGASQRPVERQGGSIGGGAGWLLRHGSVGRPGRQ